MAGPRTFTLLLVAACAASPGHSGGGGVPDAGVTDARRPQDGGVDATPDLRDLSPEGPVDAGAAPNGVCGEAAAAAPLGVLATRREGSALYGLGANGSERLLHRAFADVAVRGEVLLGAIGGPARIAGVASAEADCATSSCPRLFEAFLIDRDGVRTASVDVPAGFEDARLLFTAGDGIVQVRVFGAMRSEDFTRLVDVRAGRVLGDLGCCSSLAGTAPPDAAGWRTARLGEVAGSGAEPGFLRFVGRGA